jgi:nicotinate-nucleotide pyrophosphorylase (carboxylating)
MSSSIQSEYQKLIEAALDEDIGSGDITSEAILDPHQSIQATIKSKQAGILAGIQVASQVFKIADPKLQITKLHHDKDRLMAGEAILRIHGSARSVLKAERVSLNSLAHLSGIATLTDKFVQRIQGLPVKIIDTRKTTPLWRKLEKQAVLAGGGHNHRMGLYDMILIKENHIQAAGSIAQAVARVTAHLLEKNVTIPIEVETTTLDEVHEALTCKVDRIMLDNMTISEMAEAVRLINRQVKVEASGGVHLENVRAIAETGVDYISIGALTHSAPAFDFSLLIGE